jgi:acetyl esterase/lipase
MEHPRSSGVNGADGCNNAVFRPLVVTSRRAETGAVAAWVLLSVGVLGVLATTVALVGPTKPALLAMLYFFVGWPVSELTVACAACEGVVTAALLALGAWQEPAGRLGLFLTFASLAGMLVVRHERAAGLGVLDGALRGLGADLATPPGGEQHRRARHTPFRRSRRDLFVVHDIAYGPYGRENRLDVYRRRDPASPLAAPVVVYLHPGAWRYGSKDTMCAVFVRTLARAGFVCVVPNYRLSPAATFPDHLVDAKRAIAWARTHAAEHGGDGGFVAVAGGSAGAHLAALCALTANDTDYQPGFEKSRTDVDACVAMYGCYDFCDSRQLRGRWADMAPMLEKHLFKCARTEDRIAWEKASPIFRLRADAPPFLILHGTSDPLFWCVEAQTFADALAAVSTSPVTFVPIPHASHAFDAFFNDRSRRVVEGVGLWLDVMVHAAHASNLTR